MRILAGIDYGIIVVYAVACAIFGLWHTRRASRDTNEFFLTGRSMPWWLLGVSMAATNFSVDTPLAIAKYVYREGIGGVWFFWASAISGMMATFFFATLWRRAEVMTDVEIIERRYSGPSAAFLRVFKGCYFGVLINCFVMGWVLAAFIKVMTGLTDLDLVTVVGIATALVACYTLSSGLYGVILTDFIQYGIALFGSIALAWYSVRDVGGIDSLLTQLTVQFGADSGVTNFFPKSDSAWMPLSVFYVYTLMQWWAHKYSDGGGKHIQRMCSAKDERHAVLATFFFTLINYAVQVWPWILTTLCALVIFGRDLADPEMSYVMMIGRQLPHGLLGLMVVTLIAAFMSTMSTHINLGGSYLINDIYRRFMKPDATEAHYLLVSRVAMLALLGIGVAVALQIESVGSAWKLVLEFTGGAGLTWVVRWLWWRANAWTEVAGMAASAVVTVILETAAPDMLYSWKMCWVVGLSTAAWLVVTLWTAPVDEARLVEFVRKVRPGTPGWKYIYNKYDIPYEPYGRAALLNFLMGVGLFLAANFGLGAVLLNNARLGVPLLVVAAGLLIVLLRRIGVWSAVADVADVADVLPDARADAVAAG